MADRTVLAQCLVWEGERILLGRKKRGLGAGWWNHAGGHVEAGESPEAAARREVREEFGLTVVRLEPCGRYTETFADGRGAFTVHTFRALEVRGVVRESDEMAPRWFGFAEIPYREMWPDDEHWLPLVLAGKKFRGHFSFHDPRRLLAVTIEELSELG